MNISYYNKWIEENELKNLTFKEISSFEDIILISFTEKKQSIVITLNDSKNLIFIPSIDQIEQLEFSINSELKNINFHLKHAVLKNVKLIESFNESSTIIDKNSSTLSL